MNRYIDADAALKRFEEIHGNESDLFNYYNADWIVSFIETQPTADVQESKHGEWISRGDCGVTCSNCKYNFNGCLPKYYYQYCPMCGAKMNMEEQEP